MHLGSRLSRPLLGLLLGSSLLAAASAQSAAAPAEAPPATPNATFYVDPISGSDAADGSSPSRAWRTLDRLSRQSLAAGTTVLLRGGADFGDQVLSVPASGTRAKPIRVGAYPATAPARVCVEVAGSWVTVTGVAALNCGRAGIDITGDNVTVTSVEAAGNVAGVWIRPGAERATVSDSFIHDNDLMADGTDGPDDDYGAFGVEINGDRAVVTGNRFSGHVASSSDYGTDGSAVEVYKASEAVVTRNVSTDNLTFIELGGAGSSGTTVAYNEVTSTLPAASFLMTRGPDQNFGPVTRTKAVHNSVYLRATGAFGFGCYGGCDPSILAMSRNLMAVEGRDSYVGYADGTFASRDNLYVGELYFPLGRADAATDPQWVGAANGDFTLRPGSPAIDRVKPLGRYKTDATGAPVPSTAGQASPMADLGARER